MNNKEFQLIILAYFQSQEDGSLKKDSLKAVYKKSPTMPCVAEF
jgi:hypothetical protein